MIEAVLAAGCLIALGAMFLHEGFSMINDIGRRIRGLVFVFAGALMVTLALFNIVQEAVLNVLRLEGLI